MGHKEKECPGMSEIQNRESHSSNRESRGVFPRNRTTNNPTSYSFDVSAAALCPTVVSCER